MKKENIIRFSSEEYKRVTGHLASAGSDESIIYGIFSKAQGSESNIYICSSLIIPDKIHLEEQSGVSIVPSRKYQALCYGLAYDLKKTIIDIHTHPFSSKAKFSSIDHRHGTLNAKYIAKEFPEQSTMGMIVLGKGFDNFDAQVWNKEKEKFEPVSRIEILGCPTVILTDTEAKPVSHDKIYSRHKIIPGWKQGLLENLRIFLCGLGGNGALVFDSLLALGIGSAGGWIRACDPDILEESNLPRIPYAYPWHVGLPKAVVAAEHARRKNLKLNTQCYGMALEDKQMIESIKQANLIIGAIDNDGARMTLNGLAARYGIPYIDLGTEIIPGDNRYEAIGQIRCFIPGKTGCLVCTGAIDPSNAALDSMSEEDRDDYQRAGYIRGEKETPTPSVLHLNGVVSHLAISQFLKMIFDDNFESSDYIHYDRQKSMLLAASSLRDDQCPVCGINGYIAQGDETGHELEELEEFKNNDVLTEKAQVVEKEDKQ